MRTPLVLLLCILLPSLSVAQPLPEPSPTVAASLLHPSPLPFSLPEFSTSTLPEAPAPAPQYYPPYPCCYPPAPPRYPPNTELIVIGTILLIFLISAAVH